MKFLVSLSLAVLFTISAAAQSPSKVLKQAEKALGGQKALLAVRSTNRTGTIKRVSDGVSGKESAMPPLRSVRVVAVTSICPCASMSCIVTVPTLGLEFLCLGPYCVSPLPLRRLCVS